MDKKTLASLIGILILLTFLSACSENRSREERREHCANLERENIFWRVMNGEDIGNLPDVPEKILGVIAFTLISPLPNFFPEDRLLVQQTALNAFHVKYGIFLSDCETEGINLVLSESESPGDRLSAFRQILSADMRAAEFLERMLNDEERMTAFMRGDHIPLHQIPPCCATYH